MILTDTSESLKGRRYSQALSLKHFVHQEICHLNYTTSFWGGGLSMESKMFPSLISLFKNEEENTLIWR